MDIINEQDVREGYSNRPAWLRLPSQCVSGDCVRHSHDSRSGLAKSERLCSSQSVQLSHHSQSEPVVSNTSEITITTTVKIRIARAVTQYIMHCVIAVHVSNMQTGNFLDNA